MSKIYLKTFINVEPILVFNLSRNVSFHEVSAKHTKEKAIAGITSGLMGLNDWVTWRAVHLGISQKLTTKITAFDSPHFFVDEMTKGAFKVFKHQHFFKECKKGTLMVDIIEFESPLGLLGKLFNFLFLKRYLKEFLKKRNQEIKVNLER